MSTTNLRTFSTGALAAAAWTSATDAAGQDDVRELLAKIRDEDENVRYDAWNRAGSVGAPAIAPLAALNADSTADLEVRRAAGRALWDIVRHVGRPGAEPEKQPVTAELVKVLRSDHPLEVRREALWMLSETGGDPAVTPIAELLSNDDLREDARMVLERLPGEKSLAALTRGLEEAPADFKPNLAQSLRKRGVEVPGLPCRKLEPTRHAGAKRDEA